MSLKKMLENWLPGRDLAARHDPYFVQHVRVSPALRGMNRVEVFSRICGGRSVLHVGCADWPITDPCNSLHVQLDVVCARLDGIDLHQEALDLLKPHSRGRLTCNWNEVPGPYDLMLVPEVLEHVGNVEGFLKTLDAVDAGGVVLTVPDAYQCHPNHFGYDSAAESFVEAVHPDHNCWFTPYTLANTIRKYTNWRLEGIWFFNKISLLAVVTRDAERLGRPIVLP